MSVAKEMFSRKRMLPIALIIAMILMYLWRKPEKLMELHGQTFGTINYTIKYKDTDGRNFKAAIDSLLIVFNNALNHYQPSSELSRFNSDSVLYFELPYMYKVLQVSKQVYHATAGGFNPALMPIINAWGFGPDKSMAPDSVLIDSLLAFTKFELVQFDKAHVWKLDIRTQLDFSAVAKGQGVDVVIDFLMTKGITDVFVEIGGEVNARGSNAHGDPWRIAIFDPTSDAINQTYIAVADLHNKAIATSANNFNYVVIDGVRYAHTINPATGYPAKNHLLSASVIANNCILADAYATAFMALGYQKSRAIVDKNFEIEAFLVYSLPDGSIQTYVTDGIKEVLHQQKTK